MIEKGHFWKHFRKLLVMVICASAFYGVVELMRQISHGTVDEWLRYTFRWRGIAKFLLLNLDFFGFHLWYFHAVLYCLIIFYYADKWGLTKYLRYSTPILLLLPFLAAITQLDCIYYRNFLFMGLPCMMIGRMIREDKDQLFSFLSKRQYMWVITALSLLLSYVEMYCINLIYSDGGVRDIYAFTLPIVLPFFYGCLRHPDFGKDSWLAVIGRKYSAYIYIFHVAVGRNLLPLIGLSSVLNEYTQPFVIFGISLCVAWLFDKALHCVRASKTS